MKIAVCIKQVPDTETKIKINSDQTGIDHSGIKWVMNPYDEFAVEEALKLKTAKGGDSKVTIFSLGPKKRVVETIRTALAMGGDEGVVINSEESLDCFATAKALSAAIKAEGDFDIIFTGKLAIDDNASSVSQLLAEFLYLPHSTVISKFEDNDGTYTLEREVEGGTKEIIQLTGPSVIGANKGLNTPRYASLPGIMKAKKKPMKEVEFSSLGVREEDVKIAHTNYTLPAEKPPVKMIDGDVLTQSKELAKLLREEAKVL